MVWNRARQTNSPLGSWLLPRGVAVLFRVALTDFSTALERALKNRSAAPASLPCVPLFGFAIFLRPGEVFARRRRSAPLQVLLSAVECFQKDYCKRKETAFLESCRRNGSPPGRRSYRPRNRGLTKAPPGFWFRCYAPSPFQVLLSAVECFQKDYCKRKETAFLKSCL